MTLKKQLSVTLCALGLCGILTTPLLAQNTPEVPSLSEKEAVDANVLQLDLLDENQKQELSKNLKEISQLRRATIPEEMEKNKARIMILRKQFREAIVEIAQTNYVKNADPKLVEMTNLAMERTKDRTKTTRPEDLIARGLYQNNEQSFTIGTAYKALLEINQDFIDRERTLDDPAQRRDIYLQQSIYVSELCAFLADEIDYLTTEGIQDIRTAVNSKKATLQSLKDEIENDPVMKSDESYINIMQAQVSAINDMLRAWDDVEREADEKEDLLIQLRQKKKDFETMRVIADRQIRIIRELSDLEVVLAALKRVDELTRLDNISILVLPTDFVDEYLNAAFPREQQ